MNINEAIGTVKKFSDVSPQAYSDVVHPSAENVGKALGTVTGLLNTFLTPIELLNEAITFKKEQFLIDYKNKLESIPDEKICAPNFAVIAPMIDHLKYKITEDELREKYAKLLSEASNCDSLSKPLLSFDNVLDQLSPYEIELLSQLFTLLPEQNYPLASIQVSRELGYTTPYKNIPGIAYKDLPFDTISVMISNFERLGIVNIDYIQYVEPHSRYDYIYNSPLFEQLQKNCKDSRDKTGLPYPECSINKHSFNLTRFGISFFNTVIR